MPKRKEISEPDSLARTSLEIERPLFAQIRAISALMNVPDRNIYNRAIRLWIAAYYNAGGSGTALPSNMNDLKFLLPSEREKAYSITKAGDEELFRLIMSSGGIYAEALRSVMSAILKTLPELRLNGPDIPISNDPEPGNPDAGSTHDLDETLEKLHRNADEARRSQATDSRPGKSGTKRMA